MVDSNQSARFTSLEELLAAIQRRPTAYLSKCYISCLKAFLDGWHLLAYQYGVEVEGQALGAFQDWIAAKYCVTSSQSWADIILFYSQDERDALTNFFRLFEEWQQTVNAPL